MQRGVRPRDQEKPGDLNSALYTLFLKDLTMAKITREMTFNEVLRAYPDAVKVLRKFGMNCFGCLGAEAESLEYGAVAHGVDLEALLKDLNEVIQG